MIRHLVDFSCRNRASSSVVVLVAAMIGRWSALNLPCDALPDTGDRQVIVFSRWDRSPGIIEDQVTYPIVTRMMGMPRVKTVRGISDYGYSWVYVIFEDGTDPYWAQNAHPGISRGRAAEPAARREDRTRSGRERTGLDLPICPHRSDRQAQSR